MSAEKPPTMRQMLDTVAAKVDVLTDRAIRESAAGQSGPPPMTEARALDICMTALADLEEREKQHRTAYSVLPDQTSTDRILRHLAARFGVQLIERQYEPCNRPHADDLDRDMLVSIVTGRLV